MQRIIRMIDQDVVTSLNRIRQAKGFLGRLAAIYAPRWTWVKLISPVMLLSLPLAILSEPIKIYWLIGNLALLLMFMALYFYRFALVQKQWLDRHQPDEFGQYTADPGDRYEEPH